MTFFAKALDAALGRLGTSLPELGIAGSFWERHRVALTEALALGGEPAFEGLLDALGCPRRRYGRALLLGLARAELRGQPGGGP